MSENETLLWIIWIGGGFLLGSVMFSRLMPRLILKKDIAALGRDHNPGASNVFVNCGIPMGLLCLTLDMFKGFFPVYMACRTVDIREIYFAAVIVAPVLGHAIAPLNGFHGGKCISTAFGVMIALIPITPIGFVLAFLYIFFSVIVKINPVRYRSILTFALFGVISVIWLSEVGKFPIAVGCGAVSATALLRHTKFFSFIPEESREKLPEASSAENQL